MILGAGSGTILALSLLRVHDATTRQAVPGRNKETIEFDFRQRFLRDYGLISWMPCLTGRHCIISATDRLGGHSKDGGLDEFQVTAGYPDGEAAGRTYRYHYGAEYTYVGKHMLRVFGQDHY